MTAFKWMSRFRSLRGSIIDPFRNNAERALERILIVQYETDIQRMLSGLDLRTLPVATKLAALPQSIRGYGHVKEAQAASASAARAKLLVEFAMAGSPDAKVV